MKLLMIDAPEGGASGCLLNNGEILSFRAAAMEGSVETWIPSSIRAILEAGEPALQIVRAMIERVEKLDDAQRQALRQR